MDIRQLRYFLAVVENQSIMKASKTLHMAQPPLSQQIKKLEDELGVKLLERGSRMIQLTSVGNMLKSRAEQIIELMETTKMEITNYKGGIGGTVSIGAVSSLGTLYLPPSIKKFNANYPDVKFQIFDGETFRILELLKNNIVEIGIIRAPFDVDLFNSIILPNEPMIIAVNKYSLNCKDKKISLNEIEDKPVNYR